MAIKHFSRGVVRGSIIDIRKRKTKTNKKDYLDLKVSCASAFYGPVEIRVRMYGKTIEDLLKYHKDTPGGMIYLDGNVQILKSNGRKFLGFQAIKFQPWISTPEDQPRASFILEGICDCTVDVFTLHHIRESQQYGVDETFDFKLPEDIGGAGFGDKVTLYGHFKDIRARWGGSGEYSPIIESIDIRKKNDDPDIF